MNLSESWKSTWPVGAVFAAPNLLAGAAAEHLGPLLFAPSLPSPQTLFSSHYLASRYFHEPREELPYSLLIVLRCREGDVSHVLFFPVGENFEELGYLGLSLIGAESGIRSEHGEVFRQGDGFSHPGHRITGISAVPVDSPDNCWNAGGDTRINSLALGHLLATTLYSVNFFRVDLLLNGGNSGKQSERPVLVPTGRRTFTIPVVDACLNPNFPDESIVLLENGDLYWMKSKLGCGVKIEAQDGYDGRWLRCEFGGKPWQLFLVSSVGVTMVDLRSRNGSRRSKLARIEDPCAYTAINSFSGDRFIAFSRAQDHDFLFCVATEHHLFLYDLRQPLIPVLRWNHGLDFPSFLAVYPLRDLRPSEKFKWSSNSGFAVISGSFSNSQFSLFCCGPKEHEEEKKKMMTTMTTMLLPTMYAWELPSDLCILDRNFSSADDLVRKEFVKESQELVLGLSIFPSDCLSMPSELPDPGGFSLLRLSSSGRLQLQKYSACWKISKVEDSSRTRDSPSILENYKDALPTRQDFINLKFLSSYLSGDLSNAIAAEIKNQGTPGLTLSELSIELPNSDSLLDYIKDVGIPSNVHEMASQVALFSLDENLLHMAFSRFSDLFPERRNSSFDFPEIRNSISLFLRKPTSKSVREQLRFNPPKDQLVGPVLPLPLLLILQRIQQEEKDKDENLMNAQCGKILESVFPDISLASSQVPQEGNPFMVHEPGSCIQGKIQEHEELSLSAAKDDKFSVFICGNHEKPEESEVFDGLASFKLRFDAPGIHISNSERKILGSLKRQFSTWQSSGFDHDPCRSSKFMREI